MPEIFLSLGSNIDPEIHIPAAIMELKNMFGSLLVSSTYETASVGFEGPAFHNLVIAFQSDQDPRDIARQLRELEERHGRTRNSQKFSSRALDVDLILYGSQIFADHDLRLPRDEITRYAFVLEPLAEIAAERLHPVSGQSYRQLWTAFDKHGLSQKKLETGVK
jgi:2-amino-4-hydroxy-6-hydroxymethyldihydropteridine diphosphokinase